MCNDSGIDIVTDSVFIYRHAAANTRLAASLPAGWLHRVAPRLRGRRLMKYISSTARPKLK